MNVVVIGAQWGDEGKGKIVDYLAPDAEIVVRYSGGANAGHTIVNGDTTYKLHLVPSGIIYPEKVVVLGTGMVIDPEALFAELETLESQGVEWRGRVLISDRAHLVLPRHKKMDIELEKTRRNPIGTTGRGIGVTYSEKAAREGIRIGDIIEPHIMDSLNKEDKDFLTPYIDELSEMSIDIASFMADKKGKKALFEGAQGILLDLDTGTYPFVSSGYSNAAGAALGGGIGPRAIDKVLGVFKAYTTRVGNGPFPSEFSKDRDGDLEDTIREIGREYGVTTGRARRCGYLDLVALKYACRTNSLDGLVLTHLDVYDQMDDVTLCTGYNINGEVVTTFPSAISSLESAKPETRTFPGWKKSLAEIRNYNDLPIEAKNYIEFIEEYTETRIDIISVGYQRSQTFIRRPVWTKF